MREQKKLVMGIGHRVKSLENPDRREPYVGYLLDIYL